MSTATARAMTFTNDDFMRVRTRAWQPIERKVKLCNRVANEMNRLCRKYQQPIGTEPVTGGELTNFFQLLVKKTHGAWGLQDVEDLFAKKLHWMNAWNALRRVTAVVIANGGL